MFTAAPENTSQRNTSDQPESTLLENKTSKRGVLQFFFLPFYVPIEQLLIPPFVGVKNILNI